MNRRGIEFMSLLFFAVLIMLVALYIQLASKVQSDPSIIGAHQSGVLGVLDSRKEVDLFARGAAEFSARVAIRATQGKGGFVGDACGNKADLPDGDKQVSCFMLNTEDHPKEVCRPAASEVFTQEFNKVMDGYATLFNGKSKAQLAKDNYEVYAGTDALLAIARRPVILDITKVDSPLVLGKASFRPSVSVALPDALRVYKELPSVLDSVLQQCTFIADPSSCARSVIPSKYKIVETKGKIGLVDGGLCYGVNLFGTVAAGSVQASAGQTDSAEAKPI